MLVFHRPFSCALGFCKTGWHLLTKAAVVMGTSATHFSMHILSPPKSSIATSKCKRGTHHTCLE